MLTNRDLMTWVFFAVITGSLCIAAIPQFLLAEPELIFCGGLLGVKGGCLALFVWRLAKDRETKTPDWVSRISLCAIMVSAAVLAFMQLVGLVLYGGGVAFTSLTPIEYGDYLPTFFPVFVAMLGYSVLLVRLLQRVPGRRIFGLEPSVLLGGLGAELLLFGVLARFDWVPVLLSMGLGILMAAGCVVGMNRLSLSEPNPNRRNALVLMLIVFFMGLVGAAFSKPTSRLHVMIQYRVGKRDFRYAYLTRVDMSRAILTDADLSRADLSQADLSSADLSSASLSSADLVLADLQGANLRRADLRGAKLLDADLRGADLRGADLRGADLVLADLGGANLGKADLSEAYVRRADLSEADLSYANLRSADLRNADLHGADLRGVNLAGADLRGVYLEDVTLDEHTQMPAKWALVWEIVNQGASGRDLSGVDLCRANLFGADLPGANLSEADLSDVNLYGADLGGANLNDVNLYSAFLSYANLSDANLRGANLGDANLHEADLRGADLTEADLSGADLEEANLAGAILLRANVTEVQLAQAASLEGAILPDGTVHE